jgi:hypothetical protein
MYIDNKAMDSLSSLKSIKRHYKKDSRYVNDLYTLTYDNHESLEDTVELISSLYFRTDLVDVSNKVLRYRIKIKVFTIKIDGAIETDFTLIANGEIVNRK